MRRAGIGLVVVVVALVAAAPAHAARSERCGHQAERQFGVKCGFVRVPLDHAGSVPGSIRLHVQRVRARRPSGTAILALMGGPGSAATDSTFNVAALFEPQLKRRDLLVFDQRGTGESGALRCPSVEQDDLSAAAVKACATRLGSARAFYTSQDTVADIEAVRRAAGAQKLAIYGVSYGTKVAQQYALAHPERVDRLILDSPVPLAGSDPFRRNSLAAIPRILGDVCAPGCHPAIGDPRANLSTVLDRARAGTLTTERFDRHGRPEQAHVTEPELLEAIYELDFDGSVRGTAPAALQAAAAGDVAPLERLARRLRSGPPLTPRSFSTGLEVATLCEEAPVPWERSAQPGERTPAAQRALDAQPAEAFAPWSRSLALASWPVRGCAGWPATDRPAADLTGAPPDIPVLVLAGEHDARTPVADAERIAASYRRGRLLTVPGIGHSVFFQDNDWFEPSYGCSYRAVRSFFARDVGVACRPAEDRAPWSANPYPTSPDQYRPLGAPGARGRTVAAAMATLQDAIEVRDEETGGGGLRGGSLRANRDGAVILRSYSFVPGLTISGRVDFYDAARIRVTGTGTADSGTLTVNHGLVRGRIGGQSVRAEFEPRFDDVAMVGQPARERTAATAASTSVSTGATDATSTRSRTRRMRAPSGTTSRSCC